MSHDDQRPMQSRRPRYEQWDGDPREDEEVFDRIYAKIREEGTPSDPVYPPTEYAQTKLEAYYAVQAKEEKERGKP